MRYYNGKKSLSVVKTVAVGVEGSFRKILDYTKSMSYMFYHRTNIVDLTDYIAYEDTAEVVSMEYTFSGCTSLTTIPLLDTSKVVAMRNAFDGCRRLQSIPAFNTSNANNTDYMFNGCTYLRSVENLDMSKVASASSMFYGCTRLENLFISNLGCYLDLSACVNLSVESLRFIINNAQTLTATRTLKLGETNLAKLTDAQKAVATNKGWTLA